MVFIIHYLLRTYFKIFTDFVKGILLLRYFDLFHKSLPLNDVPRFETYIYFTCLRPGTVPIGSPFDFVHVMFGRGTPRDWQIILVPVVLLKSTLFGGS